MSSFDPILQEIRKTLEHAQIPLYDIRIVGGFATGQHHSDKPDLDVRVQVPPEDWDKADDLLGNKWWQDRMERKYKIFVDVHVRTTSERQARIGVGIKRAAIPNPGYRSPWQIVSELVSTSDEQWVEEDIDEALENTPREEVHEALAILHGIQRDIAEEKEERKKIETEDFLPRGRGLQAWEEKRVQRAILKLQTFLRKPRQAAAEQNTAYKDGWDVVEELVLNDEYVKQYSKAIDESLSKTNSSIIRHATDICEDVIRRHEAPLDSEDFIEAPSLGIPIERYQRALQRLKRFASVQRTAAEEKDPPFVSAVEVHDIMYDFLDVEEESIRIGLQKTNPKILKEAVQLFKETIAEIEQEEPRETETGWTQPPKDLDEDLIDVGRKWVSPGTEDQLRSYRNALQYLQDFLRKRTATKNRIVTVNLIPEDYPDQLGENWLHFRGEFEGTFEYRGQVYPFDGEARVDTKNDGTVTMVDTDYIEVEVPPIENEDYFAKDADLTEEVEDQLLRVFEKWIIGKKWPITR